MYYYLKQAQDVGDHDGHGAGRRSDHSYHSLRFADDGRLPVGAADVGRVFLDQRLDEGERLLQGVSVSGAGVQDPGPQRDVGQQIGVAVDLVQGVQHGLHAVDPLLLLQLAAGQPVGAAGVDGEQPSQSDVTRYLDGAGVEVLVGGAHLGHQSTNPEPERQQEAGPQGQLMRCLSNPEGDIVMMMSEGEGKVGRA